MICQELLNSAKQLEKYVIIFTKKHENYQNMVKIHEKYILKLIITPNMKNNSKNHKEYSKDMFCGKQILCYNALGMNIKLYS